MTDYLPCVERQTGSGNPDGAVIWLHGLGANGHDFEPIIPELDIPASANLRFIFPHAPAIPVTINGGYIMPAWYDILDMSLERKIDSAQLQRSVQSVTDLIDREVTRGISSERIVLAGFSQGGAVAYQAALGYPQPLAGLLALSTYIASKELLTVHAANRQLPIAIFHGTDDPVVPALLAKKAAQVLGAMGLSPSLSTYPMEHEVCPGEIAEIGSYLRRWLQLD